MDHSSRFVVPNWAHQEREWARRDDPSRMLKWQMRTGKTKAMVDLACYLFAEGRIDGVLVAAPNNIHVNWIRREIPKHTWEGLRYRSLAWNASQRKVAAWDMLFTKFCTPNKSLDWFSVNFEAFGDVGFRRDHLKRWLDTHPRFLMVTDETHECRGPTSKRSRALRGVRKRAAYARGLSGTIVENSPLHAWAQYELVEPGCLGYADYEAFEAHFAVKETRYVMTKSGKRAVEAVSDYINGEELTAAMARTTSVVLRTDVGELSQLQRETLTFEMTSAQKRVYNTMVLKSLARLDGGELIPVKEGGALKSQLQQIASGWYVDDEGEVVELMREHDNPRLQALRSQLALCGPKTIVWCRFREDIVRVCAMAKGNGMKPLHYYGGTSKDDRPRHEDLFRNDPTYGPLVGQPLACGQGLDFSVASWIVWYSHLDGDLIHRKQADERATSAAGGTIGITDLVAIGSGDQALLDGLEEKDLLADEVSGEGLRRFLQLVL